MLQDSISEGTHIRVRGAGRLVVDAPEAEIFTEFLEFYGIYPRKVGKRAAWLQFRRRRISYTPAEILTGLSRWMLYWRTEGKPMQYIPHPATWLQQGRCEDAPPTRRAAARSINEVMGH